MQYAKSQRGHNFFALQSSLTTQIVVPPSLPLLLVVLVGICGLALAMMTWVMSRTVTGQVLRLNED